MARVTVVNDNAEFLDLVHDILEGDRYDTTLVDGDRPEALDLIRSSRPDLLMIDVRLGVEGDHGWEIAQRRSQRTAVRGAAGPAVQRRRVRAPGARVKPG